jgi:hypothetical protein
MSQSLLADGGLSRASSSGISAWIFFGSNSSYPAPSGYFYPLDLGNVPATYNDTFHWPILDSSSSTPPEMYRNMSPPLASVLLCDPKMELSTTYVTLVTESNTLMISNETPPSRIGNISPGSAALVLAQSLLGATTIDCDYTAVAICITSASIFMEEPLPYAAEQLVHVRSASNISSTIGPYIASASKAWSDGLYATRNFTGISIDALKGQPKLALVASAPLTLTVGVLTFIILQLAAAELWIPVGEPLGIASLKDAMKSESC